MTSTRSRAKREMADPRSKVNNKKIRNGTQSTSANVGSKSNGTPTHSNNVNLTQSEQQAKKLKTSPESASSPVVSKQYVRKSKRQARNEEKDANQRIDEETKTAVNVNANAHTNANANTKSNSDAKNNGRPATAKGKKGEKFRDGFGKEKKQHNKTGKRKRQIKQKKYSIRLGAFKKGLKKAKTDAQVKAHQLDDEMDLDEENDKENAEIKKAIAAAEEEISGSESEGEEEIGKRLKVHRCRFIDWKPDAVHAVAANDSCLAVAREGGDIEIWNLKEGFHQEYTIPGRRNKSGQPIHQFRVRTLVWSKSKTSGKNRLFGAAFDGHVFEVDLSRMGYKEIVDSYGGALWSMDLNSVQETLATGCEDGHIRLFDVSSDSGIEYMRPLRSTHEGRILAVKWHPIEEETLFSAGIDGMIRKWDVNKGRVVAMFELEKFGKNTPPFVWSMIVLKDSTVVVGDSYGQVQFWDCSDETGFLLKSFREHKADVLTLTCSHDETKIFASGIDSRVSMFACNPEDKGTSRWVYSYSHRPHTHDVQALATLFVKGKETLISGGVDTQLCYYEIDRYKRTRPKKVGPFQHKQLVHITNRLHIGRFPFVFIMIQQPRHIQVYKLEIDDTLEQSGAMKVSSKGIGQKIKRHNHLVPPELLAELYFDKRNSIRSSAISRDGRLLAVSDDTELRLFRLESKMDEKTGAISHELARIESHLLPKAKRDGVPVCLSFIVRSDDTQYLACAMQSGVINILSGFSPETKTSIKKTFVDPNDNKSPVTALYSSSDGNWLACIRNGGDITIYNLKTLELHTQIPMALLGNSKPCACGFHEADNNNLVIVCNDNRFYSYSVAERQLSPWSAKNSEKIPTAITNHASRIRGLCFNKSKPDNFCLVSYVIIYTCSERSANMSFRQWSPSFMLFVDTTKRIALASEKQTKQELYKPSDKCVDLGLKIKDYYRPLVYAEFIGDDELVVVESPWIKVMQHFPNVLHRKRYGGNN